MRPLNRGMTALALTAAMAAPGGAFAASATGNAAADIAQPIAVTEAQQLNFGRVVPSGTSGTVTIATDGSRSISGGVSTLGGTVQAGTFDVTGEGSAEYSVSLPASISLSDGSGNSMTVDSFNDNAGSPPSLSGGSDSFSVGAALSVGANQTPGSYSGTYTVTVNYQ